MPKKLIEVALPLEAINAAGKREKSIRHGHPSTLHLWWSRKPTSIARAVIWACLVDDPSAHPEQFPTEDAQTKERERLFQILQSLVVWENSNDEKVLKAARDEIHCSMGDDLPEFLDPFAGGGSIPLEAQRLGLKAHAHDLNPVAVMINKAMIEIPPKFAGMPPVNPIAHQQKIKANTYKGAAGLAEDVQYYGNWLKEEAFKRIGRLYPKATLPDGTEATVIAWKWARTVKCPNPACGCQMPLVNSWELSKKKGKETHILPIINKSAKTISYEIITSTKDIPKPTKITPKGGNFRCLFCDETASDKYIKSCGMNKTIGKELIAIVAEAKSGRLYFPPNQIHISSADIQIPENIPIQEMNSKCTDLLSGRGYGFTHWHQLFTPRQLTALTTFSDLVGEAYEQILRDGGTEEYAKAVVTYLAIAIDRLADRGSTICSWDVGYTKIRNTFGRQAIPMTWDFAEGNPFSNSTGCFSSMLEWIYKCIQEFPANIYSLVQSHDAQTDCGVRNLMVSTDPPYYDNIGYADLSDFFYVWMRRSLKRFYPDIFKTMLVPKAEELVATPYRFDGSKTKAKDFFEDGMFRACEQLYQCSREDIPVTIYYAYKQSDNKEKDKNASTGWETMLSAIIRAGFQITGTWPMNSEMANRSVAIDTNSLASSIVLVCRKRAQDAPVCSLRDFQKALSKELRPALEKMQSSSIAPVDLAQSAIGPGMAVFSRYSEVLRSDDTPVTIREALELINKEIDLVFNEQDQAFDAETRFCLTVFAQYGFNDMKFGEANTLATAKNTSVERVAALGAVHSSKGIVYLYPVDELPKYESAHAECIWTLTHHLVKTIMSDGVSGCVALIAKLGSVSPFRHCKELSYRLYTACERSKNAKLAIGYNTLVTSWDEIMRGVDARKAQSAQGVLGL